MSKYGHRPHNWFEAIVNKLGGEEAAEHFLRDEKLIPKPSKRWREKDGVIYFTVTSDGTSGEAWIKRLEEEEFQVGDGAKSVLRSNDFKPTSGVTYKIAVLKGLLFDEDNIFVEIVRKKASKMKLTTPNAEVSCLIRENFTDNELEGMGLRYIVTVHESIKHSDGIPLLLTVCRDFEGRRLEVYNDYSDSRWDRSSGFAFLTP